jgi:hypothetical protein
MAHRLQVRRLRCRSRTGGPAPSNPDSTDVTAEIFTNAPCDETDLIGSQPAAAVACVFDEYFRRKVPHIELIPRDFPGGGHFSSRLSISYPRPRSWSSGARS